MLYSWYYLCQCIFNLFHSSYLSKRTLFGHHRGQLILTQTGTCMRAQLLRK